MDVIKAIKSLGLPNGQYIVVGSAIMAAKGIRPTNDLDIVVTPEIFKTYISKAGWAVLPWTKSGIPGKAWLRNGNIELYEQLSRKNGSLNVAQLAEGSETIDGIPFISLQQLIDFKREYGRPKDFADIKIIEAYLEK